MGQINKFVADLTFTPLQKLIFNEFAQNSKLTKQFYFTGGTALSAVYLHHRESEDLDFFSEDDFESEPVEDFIEKIAKEKNFLIRFTRKERTKIFELLKSGKVMIKVDFAFYPYKRLKNGRRVDKVYIDSLQDIATNKLQTITNRTEVKDFVDLFFLLKNFTLWDLIYGVQQKFKMELDLIWLGADCLKVEGFHFLPKMLVPLTLDELKTFYKDLAKKLGSKAVKK